MGSAQPEVLLLKIIENKETQPHQIKNTTVDIKNQLITSKGCHKFRLPQVQVRFWPCFCGQDLTHSALEYV